MKKRKYSIGAFIIAVLFWNFDASIHYFIYSEPEYEFIPSDFNELWMRLVIVALVILFGIYADMSSKKLLSKEKQLEATRIYNSMIDASHHILNNLLNQMQLFKVEASKSNDFDKKVLELFDNSIDEASYLIQRLSKLENITDQDIKASVNPDNVVNSPDIHNPFRKKSRN